MTVNPPPVVSHIEHQLAQRRYFVPQTSDLSLIGAYSFTVGAELSHYEDHTKATNTTVQESFTFTVFFEPCEVLSIDQVSIPTLAYTIGAGQLTSPQYSFAQVPACGYPFQIDVIDLPPFATQGTSANDFTVPFTEQLSLHGLYPVQVIYTVEHPTDHTKTDTVVVTSDFTFEIDMIDPCFNSMIDVFTIADFERRVKQVKIGRTLNQVKDVVSSTYGTQDGLKYCGPRTIEITSDPSIYSDFLTYDQTRRFVTVEALEDFLIGNHTIEARVSLDNYPMVTNTTTFNVTIKECFPNNYIAPEIEPVSIQVGDDG